jgi:hypothetical protein
MASKSKSNVPIALIARATGATVGQVREAAKAIANAIRES